MSTPVRWCMWNTGADSLPQDKVEGGEEKTSGELEYATPRLTLTDPNPETLGLHTISFIH